MSLAARLRTGASWARVPWATPASLDLAAAAALTAGSLVDVAALHRWVAPAAVLAVVCTTTVAWRRFAPSAATLVALTAVLAYELLTADPRLTFEPFALALVFYSLGRRPPARGFTGALLTYGLGALALMFWRTGGNVAAQAASGWAVFVAGPWALGKLVARHESLALALAANNARLRDGQELEAAKAASDERRRMARELHDVIAHCVSVMVIQSSAARLVAAEDAETARSALRAVETCGREALTDLRRIVGALRRSDEQLGGRPPRLSQLGALAERARAAGVPTRLRIKGPLPTLAPGLELALFRVVQEALTNVVKHAGGAVAEIELGLAGDMLEVSVTDSGSGVEQARLPESGHGLVGMRERIALHGGQLTAGPERGGWAVRARLPLAETAPLPVAEHDAGAETDAAGGGLDRWLDPTLVTGWLAVLEAEALWSRHRHGSLALNVVAVGAMALAGLWRRRWPLAFLVSVGLPATLLVQGLTSRDYATVTGLYSVIVPVYAVAAWEARGRAVLGLALWSVGATGIGIFEHASLGGLAGPLLAAGATWTVGRVIRAHRSLAARLRESAARLTAEREDRARLAAAGERIRIARDLHTLVAQDVVAMVVQAEAAQDQLDRDAEAAAASIGAIETTGRRALAQVRLILGVLRSPDPTPELEPQPALGQIHALVERVRRAGQPVEITIEGEPGAGFAGVDLTTYRILEEILGSADRRAAETIAVALRFDEQLLELEVTSPGRRPRPWPTSTIRERVALCDGEVGVASSDPGGSRLVIRMPRRVQGVFA